MGKVYKCMNIPFGQNLKNKIKNKNKIKPQNKKGVN